MTGKASDRGATPTMRWRVPHRAAALALASMVAACGGGDTGPNTPTFVFRLRDHPVTQEFRVRSDQAAFIAQARAQLALPPAGRMQFVIGRLAAGDGGHNFGWGWHLDQPAMAEMATEVCDATPAMVEAELGYWLNTVGTFCPWSAYVHAEEAG